MTVRRSTLLTAALSLIVGVTAPAAHAAAGPSKLDIHFAKTPAKLTNNATPSFSLSRNVHFGVKSQTCRLDKAAWKPCGPFTWKPGHVSDGAHTAQVRLAMKNGRVASASYTWTTDATAPSVQAPQSLAAVTAAISIALPAASDATSGVKTAQWRSSDDNGQTWTAWSSAATVTVPADGQWTFQYRATDKAGNQAQVSFAQVQVSTAPGVPVVTTMNTSAMQVGFTFAHTSDAEGPAQSYEIRATKNGSTFFDYAYTSADLGDTPYLGFYSDNCGDTIQAQVRALGATGLWSDWSQITADSTFVTCAG